MTGATTELAPLRSAVFPGTTRRVWVHVPSGHDPGTPVSLAVFQDGGGFLDPDDDLRAGSVLDALAPPTIGVFVDPGTPDGGARPDGRRQRNVEYDAFDDRYVTMLAEEVLPEVERRWAVTDDPARRGVVGFSSGGSCAVTAAWHRPDPFGAVVGFSSSFAQLPGGNPYPELLARTPRKALRLYLHVGRRDLGWDEGPGENWVAENLRVAASLVEAGYDVRLELGEGGHDTVDTGARLPDALRWALGPSA